MDSSSALKELSERATRFSNNLNGLVQLDKRMVFRGHSALVYPGVLRQHGIEIKVAVKVFRTGPPEDLATLKVLSLTRLSLSSAHLPSLPAYPPRGTLMVQIVSRKYCSHARNLDGFRLHHLHSISLDADGGRVQLCTKYGARSLPTGELKGSLRIYSFFDILVEIMDVANGLRYLHRRGIFHGDLKGVSWLCVFCFACLNRVLQQNVLISNDGQALLADFGFSTLATSTFSMTVERHFGGTLRWMAPELLDGGEASVPGDVYAFGMTALVCVWHDSIPVIPHDSTGIVYSQTTFP